ncbi:NAD(P)/FAD-dependent oxidoreductase [Mesorhizobium denitrificans]|uniref:FAD-binding oxidoreductase n=1 Tax=Mesorhizobium denitrificans TaxID=2294114 RepID=A0A371X9F9_9HYPH|nr:FAD-binding oxidoreductase [Mesorhizobium denitrificans]RFC65868.1 FAD-binding oxidoreductase [Mesorhizobium denitrificans]
MTSDEWDLIIIGAGIVGCSAAFYAAKNGMRVLVFERETPGSAQSGRNLGFVRQQGRDFRELSLAIAAMKLWEGVETELGRKVGWFRGGNLALATSDADMARHEEWQVRAMDFGLDTLLLTTEQVITKLPLLSRNANIKGAMYTASDGKAEPGRATRAYFEAALELGVSFSLGASVSRIDVSAGRVTGVWSGGRLHRSRMVLCAAGAGSGRLLRAIGLDLPQEQIRATVVRTLPRPELKLEPCVSGPLTGIRQDVRGAYVVSVAGGEYDVRWDSWRYARSYAPVRKSNPDIARINVWAPLQRIFGRGYDRPLADIPPTRDHVAPDAWRTKEAITEFRHLFPALEDTQVETSWAGIIDTLPDVVPAMGAVDALEGLLVATGFSGHGFGPGPMAGKIMADLATGQQPHIDISELSPARFKNSLQA